MRKRVLSVGLGVAGLLVRAVMGSFMGSTLSAAPERDRAARDAVRQMAAYLETAPRPQVAQLAGTAAQTESRPGEAAISRVDAVERSIAAHYPQDELGESIRHYVALTLSDVNSDIRPELSRDVSVSQLARAPAAAAAELQSSLGDVPATGAEPEHLALMRLAVALGGDEAARPAVESVFVAEISRHADLGRAESAARLEQLADAYAALVNDPDKEIELARLGLQAQDDPEARKPLQDFIDSHSGGRSPASEAQASEGDAGDVKEDSSP